MANDLSLVFLIRFFLGNTSLDRFWPNFDASAIIPLYWTHFCYSTPARGWLVCRLTPEFHSRLFALDCFTAACILCIIFSMETMQDQWASERRKVGSIEGSAPFFPGLGEA